jgi:hypothetical protein
MESVKRKDCTSLQLLCQIEVIRLLHKKASALEAEYIDQWSTRELTSVNQVRLMIPEILSLVISFNVAREAYVAFNQGWVTIFFHGPHCIIVCGPRAKFMS